MPVTEEVLRVIYETVGEAGLDDLQKQLRGATAGADLLTESFKRGHLTEPQYRAALAGTTAEVRELEGQIRTFNKIMDEGEGKLGGGTRAFKDLARAAHDFQVGRPYAAVGAVTRAFEDLAATANLTPLAFAGISLGLSAIAGAALSVWHRWDEVRGLFLDTKPIEGLKGLEAQLKKVTTEAGEITKKVNVTAGEQARLNELVAQQERLEQQVNKAKERQLQIKKLLEEKTPEEEDRAKQAKEVLEMLKGQQAQLIRAVVPTLPQVGVEEAQRRFREQEAQIQREGILTPEEARKTLDPFRQKIVDARMALVKAAQGIVAAAVEGGEEKAIEQMAKLPVGALTKGQREAFQAATQKGLDAAEEAEVLAEWEAADRAGAPERKAKQTAHWVKVFAEGLRNRIKELGQAGAQEGIDAPALVARFDAEIKAWAAATVDPREANRVQLAIHERFDEQIRTSLQTAKDAAERDKQTEGGKRVKAHEDVIKGLVTKFGKEYDQPQPGGAPGLKEAVALKEAAGQSAAAITEHFVKVLADKMIAAHVDPKLAGPVARKILADLLGILDVETGGTKAGAARVAGEERTKRMLAAQGEERREQTAAERARLQETEQAIGSGRFDMPGRPGGRNLTPAKLTTAAKRAQELYDEAARLIEGEFDTLALAARAATQAIREQLAREAKDLAGPQPRPLRAPAQRPIRRGRAGLRHRAENAAPTEPTTLAAIEEPPGPMATGGAPMGLMGALATGMLGAVPARPPTPRPPPPAPSSGLGGGLGAPEGGPIGPVFGDFAGERVAAAPRRPPAHPARPAPRQPDQGGAQLLATAGNLTGTVGMVSQTQAMQGAQINHINGALAQIQGMQRQLRRQRPRIGSTLA